MFLQIDLLDAQVTLGTDGSTVEIHGQNGNIRLEAEYAKSLKAKYEDFLKAYLPKNERLKITGRSNQYGGLHARVQQK